MRPAVVLVAVLLGGSAVAAATMLSIAGPSAPQASITVGDWNDERPGPDSARVATLLDAMQRTDPVACEMLSDQVGNFWWGDGDWGIGRLSDARPDIRAAKDSVSGRVRDAAAIRHLVRRLDSDDPCVRRTAAKMLGHSTMDDQQLAALLDAPTARAHEAALLAIGEAERPGLRQRVERELRGDDPAIVAMAVWALGELEDRESVGPLQDALRHDVARVRMTAAWALGMIEDPKAVPALLRALDDREVMVRWAVVDAFGDIESREAADALERIVRSDDDRRVRLAAIEALGNIEDPGSVDALAAVLDGTDIELSVAAAEAIGNLDNLQRAPAQLLRAAASSHRELRRAAIFTLESLEDPAGVPVMMQAIGDPDPEIRRAAIEMLGEVRAMVAKDALTRALEDQDAEVRMAAIEALAELEDR